MATIRARRQPPPRVNAALPTRRSPASQRVSLVYREARRATGELFVTSGLGGLYGELTQDSMGAVLAAIDRHAPLRGRRFLDVGSGLGLPVLHAACLGARAAGIELCASRHMLAVAALARTSSALNGGGARFWQGAAEDVAWDADVVYVRRFACPKGQK